MPTLNQIVTSTSLTVIHLLLAVGLAEGAADIRAGFASGGLSVSQGYSVRGGFSPSSTSVSVSPAFSLQSGVTTILDYSFQGSQRIVLANPDDPSGVQDLTAGELFFYAGLATGGSDEAVLYSRLPKIIEGASGLAVTYDRSGAASLAMGWTYEISTDLVNWTSFVPAAEDVRFDGSKNIGTVSIQLPVQSPVFVRIQLNYNEQ